MNKSNPLRRRLNNQIVRIIAAACLNLLLWLHSPAYASGTQKNSWIAFTGEVNSYNFSGDVDRQGITFLNFHLNMSKRVASEVWFGLSGFLGHDSDPRVNRNYDTSIGLILHWFPLSLSGGSSLAFEGLILTEQQTIRPFLHGQITYGRVLLRRVLTGFDASADYLGLNVGAGTQYALNESFALSTSIGFQLNVGLSQLPFSGNKFAYTLGGVYSL